MTQGAGEPDDSAPGEDAGFEAVRRQLKHAVKRLCPEWLSSYQDDIVQAALILTSPIPHLARQPEVVG